MPSTRRAPHPAPRPKHPVAKRLEHVRALYRIPTLKAFWEELGGLEGAGCGYEAVRNYHFDREAPVSYLAAVIRRFPEVRPAYLLLDEKPVTVPGAQRVQLADEWPQGQVDKLSASLATYCAGVVGLHLTEQRPGPELRGERTVRGTAVSARDVLREMGDDPLAYLARRVRHLTDKLLMAEQLEWERADAAKWRALPEEVKSTSTSKRKEGA